MSDKNFRNKQVRDRRLRELQSNNMKKFMDERKRLVNKHESENALLTKVMKEEEDLLIEENKKVKIKNFEKISFLTNKQNVNLIIKRFF